MSQSESESNIWEYKSLKKTKRPNRTQNSSEDGPKQQKKKKTSEKTCSRSRLSTESKTKLCRGTGPGHVTQVTGPLTTSPLPPSGSQSANARDGPSSEPHHQPRGYCPVCQMPFSILVVQTPQWHVAECLENPGEPSTGRSLPQEMFFKINIRLYWSINCSIYNPYNVSFFLFDCKMKQKKCSNKMCVGVCHMDRITCKADVRHREPLCHAHISVFPTHLIQIIS